MKWATRCEVRRWSFNPNQEIRHDGKRLIADRGDVRHDFESGLSVRRAVLLSKMSIVNSSGVSLSGVTEGSRSVD